VLLYDLHLILRVTEQIKRGVRVVHSYYTPVDAFSVAGGPERFIWKDGRGKIGDADVMTEFYRARQFGNLMVRKLLNRETLIVEKIYERNLAFGLTFVVQGLAHSSPFRCLQLDAENARFAAPPDRDSRFEALSVEFSDARIFYWHENGKSGARAVVKEEI
jgi:hypothetical protein